MAKTDLTAERARELLHYDPETGRLSWRTYRRSGIRAGQTAGALNRNGYLRVSIARSLYAAHRLAWLIHYGEWPAGDVDHINGDRADNRISNLRVVTTRMNNENRRRAHSNSKTQMLGVSPSQGAFQADICVNGRRIYLGRFSSAEAAHAAYLQAKRDMQPGCTI